MNCPKCHGLMLSERVLDYSLAFYAWKCVNCGALLDQTILSNQFKRKRSSFKRIPVTGKVRS